MRWLSVFSLVVFLCSTPNAIAAKARQMKTEVFQGDAVTRGEYKFLVRITAGGKSCLGALIAPETPADAADKPAWDANQAADTVLTTRDCLLMVDWARAGGDIWVWADVLAPAPDESPQGRRVGYHSYQWGDDNNGPLALLYLASPFERKQWVVDQWIERVAPIKLGEGAGETRPDTLWALSEYHNALASLPGDAPSVGTHQITKAQAGPKDAAAARAAITALRNNAAPAWASGIQTSHLDAPTGGAADNYFFTADVTCSNDWSSLYVAKDGTARDNWRLYGFGVGLCRNDAGVQRDANQPGAGPKECISWTALMDPAQSPGEVPSLGCGDVNSADPVLNLANFKTWIMDQMDPSKTVPTTQCLGDTALLANSARHFFPSGITICYTLPDQIANPTVYNEVHVELGSSFQLDQRTQVKRVWGWKTQPDKGIVVDTKTNTVRLMWEQKPEMVDGNTARRFTFEIYGLRNPNNCDREDIKVQTHDCPYVNLHNVPDYPIRKCKGKTWEKIPNANNNPGWTYPTVCSLCNACYSFARLPSTTSAVDLYMCWHERRSYARLGETWKAEPCGDREIPLPAP